MIMNTLSRKCFRLSSAILNNSAFLRPFCPAFIKPDQFCRKLCDIQNVPQDQFDDFENPSPGHELFENIDIDSIVGDDLEMKKSLQKLILELSMQLQTETLLAPKKLQPKEWRALLDRPTNVKRAQYLKYLYVKERRKEMNEHIKRTRIELIDPINESKIDEPLTTSSPMEYSLRSTTLFDRIYLKPILQRMNFNLALAWMFGEDLVIDCSYEEYMTTGGINSCARHLTYLFSNNRLCTHPFNLILCNVGKNSKLMDILPKTLQNLHNDDFFMTVTEKHYLDLYPAEKLIYMTPHCDRDMEKYEEDCVYILGAYVDPGKHIPISSAKAKKDGIKTARLPLDKYLNWSQGTKLLPFNSCARILHDVKSGACWQYALRHIDVRKQKFQYIDNDVDIEKERRAAISSVREEARRSMLYNHHFKRVHPKKEDECSSSDFDDKLEHPDDNKFEYSANDKF